MERLTRVASANFPATPKVHSVARHTSRTPDSVITNASRTSLVRTDVVEDPACRIDPLKIDGVKIDASRRIDAVSIDAPRIDAVTEDAVKEDAVKEDAVKEDAPETRAVRIDAPETRLLRTPRPPSRVHESTDRSHSHGRIIPGPETSRKDKRSSLNFPINPGAAYQSPLASPTRIRVPPSLPESSSPPVAPTDAHFLTALAAQERRVLELKEELSKAETELRRLKQDWAIHEAQRKRQDMRRSQRLKPLSSPTAKSSPQRPEDDPDGSSAWMVQEMERRKALLQGPKQSNRTVFSGSRHTRTLSLLSPVASSTTPSTQQQTRTHSKPRSPTAPEPPNLFTRLSTHEPFSKDSVKATQSNIDIGIPGDALMKTGKQIATDFKDGLWTFIEDLRQATVGEDGINGTVGRSETPHASPVDSRMLRQQATLNLQARPPPLKRSSTTAARRAPAPSPARSARSKDDSAVLDQGSVHWTENGASKAKIDQRQSSWKKDPQRNSEVDCVDKKAPQGDVESWQNWEKAGRYSSDTSTSDRPTSPSPGGTSPGTSIGSARDGSQATTHDQTKRDAIPWPALTKLASSSLRQTASNLLADWEKSLTPPTEEVVDQPDYLNRASSAGKKAD